MTDPFTTFDREELEALLELHLERQPDLEADDLLKLLLQAYQGPGHAIHDVSAAWSALRREAHGVLDLEVKPWEDAIDTLRPSTEVARVHLRPYLRMGGDLSVLHATFLASAERFAAVESSGALRAAIAATREWLREDELDVEFDERDFSVAAGHHLKTGEVPRHSARYRQLYAPAYRVVVLPFVDP